MLELKGAVGVVKHEQNSLLLNEIERLDAELLEHFKGKMVVQSLLTRPLVSFQANKNRPIYRWYKYKEAFSASLVEYLIHKYGICEGTHKSAEGKFGFTMAPALRYFPNCLTGAMKRLSHRLLIAIGMITHALML